MHALKVALVVLALVALCYSDAAKKPTKKAEKVKNKVLKETLGNEKDSKTYKRGLYPEPHLGSTYALPGVVPLEVHHNDPIDQLSVHHDLGVYGGVYAHHLDTHAPIVAATYAPQYGHGGLASPPCDSTYAHGYLGGFPGGLKGLEALLGGVKIEEGIIRVKTITTHVPVPVPHPVPVEVIKKVPIPVPHPVPVDVPRAVKVEVPQPYPVEVPKHYPVEVPKPVPHPVPVPIHVRVPAPYPVEVPTPYEVKVHKPVPVPVPHHIEVPKPIFYHSAPTTYASHAPALSSYYSAPTTYASHALASPVISVKKCDDDHSYHNSSPLTYDHFFAKDSLQTSSPKVPSYDYEYSATPAPSYPKPSSYEYTPEHSSPKDLSYEHEYQHAPVTSYNKPSATSYVGVVAHGPSSHGGYKSEVYHHPSQY